MLRAFLLLPGLLLLAAPAAMGQAAPVSVAAAHYPALTGRVVDEAHLLTPAQAARLNVQSEKLEKEVGPQFVVVTVASLGGVPIDAYGLGLGKHWGIGSKARNDGLMLIVAPTERMVRIEVGLGLEGRVTNAFARQVIDEAILPRFRAGDYPGGIEAGASRLVARLRSTT
jgi:uncharacterized protein